jgi:hypothetical protein
MRAVICYNYRQQYSGDLYSFRVVKYLVREFTTQRSDLSDEARLGRPFTEHFPLLLHPLCVILNFVNSNNLSSPTKPSMADCEGCTQYGQKTIHFGKRKNALELETRSSDATRREVRGKQEAPSKRLGIS